MSDKVREVYLGGVKEFVRYILKIYENGSVSLTSYFGLGREVEENPSIVMVGKKMIVEYGNANMFSQRKRIVLKDETGNLNDWWDKIM